MDTTIIVAFIGFLASIGASFIGYLASKTQVEKESAIKDTIHTSAISVLESKIQELKQDIRENKQELKSDIRVVKQESREERDELFKLVEKTNVNHNELATKHRSLVNRLASAGILKLTSKNDKETIS